TTTGLVSGPRKEVIAGDNNIPRRIIAGREDMILRRRHEIIAGDRDRLAIRAGRVDRDRDALCSRVLAVEGVEGIVGDQPREVASAFRDYRIAGLVELVERDVVEDGLALNRRQDAAQIAVDEVVAE